MLTRISGRRPYSINMLRRRSASNRGAYLQVIVAAPLLGLALALLTGDNYSFRRLLTSHHYSNIMNLLGYRYSNGGFVFQSLPLQQLEEALVPWRALARARPRNGWLRAIRQALGMTTRQLAKAVGVTQGAVVDAERSEAKEDITLTTLRRYAAALDCELAYALVPNRPLQESLEARAEKLARDQVLRVRHSMALEDQQTSNEHHEREVAELRRKLLEGKRSRLWQ
jgi:predicted DNA-binding mobile mystery protein A